MGDLFETLTPQEYEQLQIPVDEPKPKKPRKSRAAVTEPRNYTTWFQLPHVMDFCMCPNHEAIQQTLNPTQKEYRQKYPVRMTYEIREGMPICRDCYVNEGDK